MLHGWVTSPSRLVSQLRCLLHATQCHITKKLRKRVNSMMLQRRLRVSFHRIQQGHISWYLSSMKKLGILILHSGKASFRINTIRIRTSEGFHCFFIWFFACYFLWFLFWDYEYVWFKRKGYWVTWFLDLFWFFCDSNNLWFIWLAKIYHNLIAKICDLKIINKGIPITNNYFY